MNIAKNLASLARSLVRRFLPKDYRLSQTTPAEVNLIGLNELALIDRWELEGRSRALAVSSYLGDNTALCRVLGRYKLYVGTDDVGFGAHVLLDGLWESWLTVFMARLLKPGMTVVDAGANHGYYTVLFADLVGPTGRVASIEPNATVARLLRRTIAVNGFDGRVQVFENALSDQDGQTLIFHAPPNEPKNARVVGAEWANIPGSISVSGARLDTLLGGWSIDFMKIDVEGAEEVMLAGAWSIIERDRPEILLEFNATRCADPAELLSKLEGVYGPPRQVGYESQLVLVSRNELLDLSNLEDWMLYYSTDSEN